MQVTYIGLSEYFQRCIPKAKRKGYFLIISLIARYSDAQDLYEKLEKDWASLNDLTGDKILFVFSTPKARKRASFFHIPGKEPYEGVMCPFIELLNGRGVEDNNGSFEFQYGGYNKIDWKQRHSQTITEFAMNYNILEKEIPCLFLYDLIGNRYKVIPVGQSTDIYVMIKAMVEEIAEYRKKCVNIEGQLEKYRKIEEYYCLYEKLENEAEKENSKQCVAIRKVLREVQSYKEVNDVIDQTRRGISSTEKCAGEVDILIEEDGSPVTIIEALNLDSLNTHYLDRHIDKIYRYDTVGNMFNIILSYVSVSNFSKFCEKYFKHIKEHQYLYPLLSADDSFRVENFPYSDIRVMKTVHNRNGCDTVLYHVCVLIRQ